MGRDGIHQRRRQAVIRFESEFLETAADRSHLRRIGSRLDDRRYEGCELRLRPALLRRQLGYYAEQSCTAGRSSFITGQSVLRTGLSKVGIPGATVGLQPEDITIAEALKPLGYATGQFGKNHLGDRNEFLPTVHGFDEFYGNLYHLNAEEDPEDPDYPKDPRFKAKFGPRGVIRGKATDQDDPTVDPRFGKVGKQTIEDTGPLTRKRMETIDDETTAAAIDFIQPKNGS